MNWINTFFLHYHESGKGNISCVCCKCLSSRIHHRFLHNTCYFGTYKLWRKNQTTFTSEYCIWILITLVGGAVTSWIVCSTLERAVRVRALAGDIVLCSWAKHLTLTVPLSTQVYKCVPANLILGVTLRWTSIPSRGGSRNTPTCSRFMLLNPG